MSMDPREAGGVTEQRFCGTPGTAQQLVAAFPWATAFRDLLRDRDGIYRQGFRPRAAGLGRLAAHTTPRRPWPDPDAARGIGSIRREGLDPGIMFTEDHLRRVLANSFPYAQRGCPVQSPDHGRIVAVRVVGEVPHHSKRKAA